MRYVNPAIATLADAIELDAATDAYTLKAMEDLHTLPKADMLMSEAKSLYNLAFDRLARCAMPLNRDTFATAMTEIARRKKERKRAMEIRAERARKALEQTAHQAI